MFFVFLAIIRSWNLLTLCFALVLRTENLMWHFSRSCRTFFSSLSFCIRERLRQLVVHVNTLEAWKLRTWLAYTYFPVWHFLNKVPLIVPVLKTVRPHYFFRDASVFMWLRNSVQPHSPPLPFWSCLLSFDSPSTHTFRHVKFKQREYNKLNFVIPL
jgi:hypothetical protein